MIVHRTATRKLSIMLTNTLCIIGMVAVFSALLFLMLFPFRGSFGLQPQILNKTELKTIPLDDINTFDSQIYRKQYVPMASKRGIIVDLKRSFSDPYVELVCSANKWHIEFFYNESTVGETVFEVSNEDTERKIISVPNGVMAYDSMAFIPLNGRNQYLAYLNPIAATEENVLSTVTKRISQTRGKNPTMHDITGVLGFFDNDDGEKINIKVQSISELDVLLLAIVDDKDRVISSFPDGSILETVNSSSLWLTPFTSEKTGRAYQLHKLRLQYRYIEEDGSSDPDEFKTSDINPFLPYNDAVFNGTEIRTQDNLAEFSFVEVNGDTVILKGDYIQLDRMLFVPRGKKLVLEAGQTIDLSNDATVFCRDAIEVNGTEDKPVRIISSDGTGDGLIVVQANNGFGRSTVNYLVCDGLDEIHNGIYAQTGCVAFYESDADFFGCQFLNNKSEDGLNLIRSDATLRNCRWYNTFQDAFDSDFCTGIFDNCYFELTGNDALDISGSSFTIKNCEFKDIHDKCVSIGEQSNATIDNIYADTAQAILGVKDNSVVYANNITGKDVFIGYLAYQKKPEFGHSVAHVENLTLVGTKDFDYLIEKDEVYYLDGRQVVPRGKKKEALLIQKIINEEPILR